MTAGPCREAIDPVRFLSNRSSGKMGYALAEAALVMGAQTLLISGPAGLTPPPGVELVSVETTQQMYEAVAEHFGDCDVLIMAAAPADFTVARPASHKIKKKEGPPQLRLEPTVDILKAMAGRKRGGQVLVGFALETENGLANARKKLSEKKLDMIVLNNPRDEQAAFEHDTNRVTIVRPRRRAEAWPLMSKQEISSRLLDIVSRML